jgi:hypothetical protein
LPIVLLLAQSAAIAHEFGHLLRGAPGMALAQAGGGEQVSPSNPGNTPTPSACDACATWAQIAGAVGNAVPPMLAAADPVAADAAPLQLSLPAEPPAQSSRGPPALRPA